MDKLEKVKKYLEHCTNNNGCDACEECAYGGESYLICKNLVKDALDLMKEEHPRKVNNIRTVTDSCLCGECPSCGGRLFTKINPNFCGHCGDRITWKVGDVE